MGLLLHLSDLHLSDPNAVVGDYKTEVVPVEERQHKRSLIRATLTALARHLESQGDSLDAIVVSGDVTYQGAEDGFALLDETLADLGDFLPDKKHIVVVPGNHDVAWRTPPSLPERYDAFVRLVRGAGYVTPLLEGIDLDENGNLTDPVDPILDLSEAGFLIVAANSSNYCGSLEPLNHLIESDVSSLEEKISAGDGFSERVLKEIEGLRLVDIARISQQQMFGLRTSLARVPIESTARRPIKILVTHHHLLPVGLAEEVKRYEALTNLGQVRQFIAANEFQLVLHGHKHTPATYLDRVYPYRGEALSSASEPPPVMISSVGTVGRELGYGREIARLVRVEKGFTKARPLTVQSVAAVTPGTDLTSSTITHIARAVFVRKAPSGDAVQVFEGATVDEVYEQLIAMFETPGQDRVRNVVCRVTDGSTARRIPTAYPKVAGVENLNEWFKETVEWWQKENPSLRDPQFNHGERIFHFAGETNQFDDVVAQLSRDPNTTRGVVVLLDPPRDSGAELIPKPSFCLVQFVADLTQQKLHCIGFFRKHQMRMWWPINVAEIAHLQDRAVSALQSKGRKFSPGEIVTISAVAVAGTEKPRVIVPLVDRLAAEDPSALWSAAFALFHTGPSSAEDITATWNGFFDDWHPTESMEPDGVPVALDGIDVLQSATALFSDRYASTNGKDLADQLQQLHRANTIYAKTAESLEPIEDRRQSAYATWREQVADHSARIKQIVTKLLADLQTPSP